MSNFIQFNVNNHIIELIPNKEKERWLICFDGYLYPNDFCRKTKLDYEKFIQILRDNNVYERNGNFFIDQPEIIEHLIVAFKLIL
jgi:hypothetical protein